MTKSNFVIARGLKMDLFAGEGESGWNDAWCYPQMHQYLLPLVKEDDTVLDIGAGIGRSSFPFALKGSSVHFVDTDDEAIAEAVSIYQKTGLSFEVESFCDANTYLNGSDKEFDVVILSETLTHIVKSEGLKIVEKAIDHCRKYMFIAAPSVLSWSFEAHKELNYGSPEVCTYLDLCDCSGLSWIEPFSYYYPGEIESLIVSKGGHIIIAQSQINHAGNYAWIIIASF